MIQQQPFFYDVTLRDGNQALKKPWNTAEKKIILDQLLQLNVQGVEIGFPAASEMDYQACVELAAAIPSHVVCSVLARANAKDITAAVNAVKGAHRPRIHTFIAMNPLGLEHVLRMDIHQVTEKAVNAVRQIKRELPRAEIEFSVEHFGDCRENLADVIDAIQQVVDAGADVINLPNTVERYRPKVFTDMVRAVKEKIGDKAVISVHCHNDLGMATATTLESFFEGATQVETTINGIGERAGNTNMNEVAVAMYNAGVRVPLRLEKIAEASAIVAKMSHIPVPEKAPIVGKDVLAHRSGIHQDGANKTKGQNKGQYISFPPELVGRSDGEQFGFTSQSGKSALFSVYEKAGYPITMEEIEQLMPDAKKAAEETGELTPAQLDELYRHRLCETEGPYQLRSFDHIETGEFQLAFTHNDQQFSHYGNGNGPIESCIRALNCLGFVISVSKYHQEMLHEEQQEAAEALTTMSLKRGEKTVLVRAIDQSTMMSGVRAVFNGLNRLERMN